MSKPQVTNSCPICDASAWRTTGFPEKFDEKVFLCWNNGWQEPRIDVVTFEEIEQVEDEQGNRVSIVLPVDEDGDVLEFDGSTQYAWKPVDTPATLGTWEVWEGYTP